VVDSTYRWAVVVILAVLYAMALLPGAYRSGFARKGNIRQIHGALVMILAGGVLSLVFNESILDAALLRARFGFLVPDEGIHSYGWFFIFGYGLLAANGIVLVVGTLMTKTGRLPPWISRRDEGQ